MKKNRVKKGSFVKVISGRDKGYIGKVLAVFPKINKLLVQGLVFKKHEKSEKKRKGNIITKEKPVWRSKVKLFHQKEETEKK